MKAKFLGSLALAILMAEFSQANVVVVKSTEDFSSFNKEVARIDQSKKVFEDLRPQMIGNIPMVNIGGNGVPPHIYGQYHAKRGTHKRTNRK